MINRYCILTLRNTQARLIRTQQALIFAGIDDARVFYGVDNNQLKLRKWGLSNGLIGCYISHFMMWQQYFNDTTADWFVFMEDDYLAPLVFKKEIERYLLNVPNQYDIAVLLSYDLHGQTEVLKSINEFFDEKKGVWSAALYAIRGSSLRNMCDVMGGSIDGHIDVELWKKHEEGKLNVCYAKENLGGLHEGSKRSSIAMKHIVRPNGLLVKTR